MANAISAVGSSVASLSATSIQMAAKTFNNVKQTGAAAIQMLERAAEVQQQIQGVGVIDSAGHINLLG